MLFTTPLHLHHPLHLPLQLYLLALPLLHPPAHQTSRADNSTSCSKRTPLPSMPGGFTRDGGPHGCEPLHSSSNTSDSGGPYSLVVISCPIFIGTTLFRISLSDTDTRSCVSTTTIDYFNGPSSYLLLQLSSRTTWRLFPFSNSTISTISRLCNYSGLADNLINPIPHSSLEAVFSTILGAVSV